MKNLILAYPNISGFATAAVAGTAFTFAGIKAEIKTGFLYNAHERTGFSPSSSKRIE
ncbi:MAG: hypothetical protein Q7J15_11320 [Candidatus Desulfaltia sp.]|nr:hypothetical protein [Candidatus Desulfaltia sp.]